MSSETLITNSLRLRLDRGAGCRRHRLTGKHAIVTGSSSGIGIETARALAGAGADVTLAVRNTEAGTSELRWRHQAAVAIASSSTLAHQLEVNEFFTRLAEEAGQAGGRLALWHLLLRRGA